MCARRALIAFLVLLTVTMLHAQQADPVIDWIRNHAVPLKTPEAAEKIAGQGLVIVADSPGSLAKTMRDEKVRWGNVVKQLKLKNQ